MKNIINKLLNDESFIYLSRYNISINLFDIIPQNERSHSAMLAWLLNPREGHNMGSFFIKSMLQSLLSNKKSPLSLSIIEILNYENLIIETEVRITDESILDILIYDPYSQYLFVIENKYGASLTNNQLDRYSTWAFKQKKLHCHLKPILILIDGKDTIGEISNKWFKTNYQWISRSIRSLLGRNILTADIEKILKDYCISIDGDYSIEPQFCEYDEHLAILAEKYPELITWVQSEYDNKGHLGILDEIKEIKNDDLELFLRKNSPILLELVEYSRYNWLNNELKKVFNCSIRTELNGTKFSIFSNFWSQYLKEDIDECWPIYLQLEEIAEESYQYVLKLCFNKPCIAKENEKILEKIAEAKGFSLKKNRKFLKITLYEFDNWDKHQVLSIIKQELEKH